MNLAVIQEGATVATDDGPIALDEARTFRELGPEARARLREVDASPMSFGPTPPEVWRNLAELPGYLDFARPALEAAAERAEAIQAGALPYRADKAFTGPEVAALGRAARVALVRDEPWLPQLFERLLPAVAVAPTAAKTLPSQALLYEMARAGEEFPTPELVAAIRSARAVTRHAGVPKQLDRMLRKIEAALAGRTEVALRLPSSDFDENGELRREVGDCTAIVRVGQGNGGQSVELLWERDGRPLRSVPAPVRRDHAAEVKELRELAKRVAVQVGTLTRALEGGLAVDAVHAYGWWRSALAEHPLARGVVRRLVWELETAPGRWESVLPELDGLPEAAEDASVRLWHPIRSDAEVVRAWRDRISEHELRQPFKQAFREVYPLTPVEERSGDHSLRFAAHFVHYPRLFALFRARGWRSSLLGPWDAGQDDVAVRTLAAGRWQVRLEHSLAEEDEDRAVTGAIRFARRTELTWREVPLAEVPPVAFSEAMRDVDLFVAVTSIAIDPDWTDPGPAGRNRVWAYRQQHAFGELTETAVTRRDALARILPRLRIADRCTLDGRFLVVRGELATYRIHLGSANILMEPSGAYLCIVPARSTDTSAGAGKVFLPFEDERLSLIISKALLLADDTTITDETILRQITHSRKAA